MAKGGKRQNATGAGAASKKPKTATTTTKPAIATNSNFQGVQDAIHMHTELPESCRNMLVSCIPQALGTLVEEREPVQHALVRMIGEVMEGVRAKLRSVAEEEEAKFALVEGSKGALDEQVSSAEATLSAAAVETKERTKKLAEAAEGAKGAKAELSAKEQAQRDGDVEFEEAKTKLSTIEAAISEHYNALKEDGSGSEHFTALLPILKDASLDESLMSALPSSCGKSASERSTFDSIAIDQLGKVLDDMATALRDSVAAGAPAAEARAGEVAAAMSALEAASEEQRSCVEAMSQAQQAEKEASAALDAAKQAVAEYEPALDAARQARDAKADALEQFSAYNVGCFELLRDAQAPKAPEPKSIDEAQAQDSLAAAMDAGA